MVPERIGRYEVRGVAGSGGFATVFEGFDPRLDARVAIKVLADNKSRSPEIRRRFRQEAVLLRRMRSEADVPQLIEVFDIDETESGQPFFVMGWADRGTIGDRRGSAPWSADDVFPLIQALTQSLGHLHAAGVVHRDIKPQNLLLRAGPGAAPPATGRVVEGEQILVGDLGLAKDLANGTSAMSLIGGTERYMAPEQVVYGGSVDHRADIFAASRMIEELLRGPNEQRELRPAVRRAIHRGSAHDRADRHGTMAEWQHDLLAALFPAEPVTDLVENVPEPASPLAPVTDLAPAAEPAPIPQAAPVSESQPRQGRPLVAAAAVVAMIAAVIGLLALRSDPSPITGPATLVSGESATYTIDQDDTVRWIDPSGQSVFEPSLTITGRLPGEVTFAALVDGQRFDRTIVVETSPLGPAIFGPDVVSLGQSGTYRASVAAGDSFYWIHPERGRVDGSELTVEQLGDSFVVGIVAVSPDGIERGQQLLVSSS